MNFENVYWDWNSMEKDHHVPTILAIGDSWFWYPFPGGSLINQLGRLVTEKLHYVLAFGNNGAEAFDYIHGKYNKSVTFTVQVCLACSSVAAGTTLRGSTISGLC